MVPQESVLVMLVRLVDNIPLPSPSPTRPRGHPRVYSDRLFLKALVIMIVRRLVSVHELLSVLAEPTPEMQTLHALLVEQGRYPSRRTFERRLAALPATLPAQIGCLGRHLVAVLEPWLAYARAAAIDSTVLRARGGVWHQKDRQAGVVPHSSIDTEASWTKSGWHGWIYGWKLHLVCAVGAVWIPLAALLTPAAEADNTRAPALIRELPLDLRFLLGDQHYRDPALEDLCAWRGCVLLTPSGGPYPHSDAGVEVRRLLHKTRSVTIENFNEQFKGIFDGHQQVPTRGLVATQRFALGAIFVYQLSLLYRYQQGTDLRVGLKAFLRAA
jgi:Transposase DDE domain